MQLICFLEFVCNWVKSIVVGVYILKLYINVHTHGPMLWLTFLTYHAFKACLCYDTYIKFIASKCDVVLWDAQPRHFSPYSPMWGASWCLHNLLLVPLRSRLPHRAAGTESDGAQPSDRLERLHPCTFPLALQEGSYYPKSPPNFILPFYLCHSRGCKLVSHRFKIHLLSEYWQVWTAVYIRISRLGSVRSMSYPLPIFCTFPGIFWMICRYKCIPNVGSLSVGKLRISSFSLSLTRTFCSVRPLQIEILHFFQSNS